MITFPTIATVSVWLCKLCCLRALFLAARFLWEGSRCGQPWGSELIPALLAALRLALLAFLLALLPAALKGREELRGLYQFLIHGWGAAHVLPSWLALRAFKYALSHSDRIVRTTLLGEFVSCGKSAFWHVALSVAGFPEVIEVIAHRVIESGEKLNHECAEGEASSETDSVAIWFGRLKRILRRWHPGPTQPAVFPPNPPFQVL